MTFEGIRQLLQVSFSQYLNVTPDRTAELVPTSSKGGKLYEAYVLSKVVERLSNVENYELQLVGGSKLRFKSSPGPINRNYPHIELRKSGTCRAELWTDVEFTSMSYALRNPPLLTRGSYHELDIVVIDPNLQGRPPYTSIWLGVECKNTSYEKNLLKEILGIRRELSFLREDIKTKFQSWPRSFVNAGPPSCLVVYATDDEVQQYSAPGDLYGIDFLYEPM